MLRLSAGRHLSKRPVWELFLIAAHAVVGILFFVFANAFPLAEVAVGIARELRFPSMGLESLFAHGIVVSLVASSWRHEEFVRVVADTLKVVLQVLVKRVAAARSMTDFGEVVVIAAERHRYNELALVARSAP